MTTIIKDGYVLGPDSDELVQADVLIENDRISAVGAGLEYPADADVVHASGKIVLPGLINAHTHGPNNLTKGCGDNWTLEDQLNHSPALSSGRTPQDRYVSAAIGAVEMLKSGCTAAYDLFMTLPAPTNDGIEAVVRAYSDVGLRAVLAPAVADIVFYETVPELMDLLPDDLRKQVESMETAPTDALLQMMEQHIRDWDGAANGRIRAAVAPTIPGQATDELLEGCGRLVREYGVGLHTHLAETKIQVIYGLNRWGMTPTAKLAELGLLSHGFVGAHGVWLTQEDIGLLASSGSSIAHNPASNLKLGSGIAPVREMLDANLNVGLGSDGSTSSDNQNLFGAMHFAGMVGNVRFPHDTSKWVGSRDAWDMVTRGSAQALGMAEDIGAIAPGRKADVILLDANSVYLRPLNDPLNALVYAETGSSVESVFVDGRLVMKDGAVLTVDEDALRLQAQEAADRLRAENAHLWKLAEIMSPYVSAACKSAAAVPYPIDRYAAGS